MEQRAERDEMWDNDRWFSGRLNLSRCYWEENGIQERRGGSEGKDRGLEVGARDRQGAKAADAKRDKLRTPLHPWPPAHHHWGLRLCDNCIPVGRQVHHVLVDFMISTHTGDWML